MDAEGAVAALEGLIRRLARQHATPQAPAEDLAQEARLAVWSHFSEYDPARGALTTWGHMRALGAILIYLRDKQHLIRIPAWKQEARAEDLAPPGTGYPSGGVMPLPWVACLKEAAEGSEYEGMEPEEPGHDPRAQVDGRLFVEQMLSRLTGRQQAVMRLHLLGLSDPEIGRRLCISGQRAGYHRIRAARILRRIYDDDEAGADPARARGDGAGRAGTAAARDCR